MKLMLSRKWLFTCELSTDDPEKYGLSDYDFDHLEIIFDDFPEANYIGINGDNFDPVWIADNIQDKWEIRYVGKQNLDIRYLALESKDDAALVILKFGLQPIQ